MSIGDIISVAGGSLKSLMSGDLLIGAFKVFEKAAGKVANSAKSVLSGLLDTGAKTAGKIGSIIEEKTGIDVDGIVAPIGDACEWLGDKVFEPGLELLKKTGASVINAGAGLVKGIAEFGESILDSAITSKANSLTSYTALFDVTNLVINKLEGNDSTGETLTQKLLQGTMSFVAEDYVGTVHSRFYEETMLGQLLDEKAFEPAKSDGGITNFASEVGYQAPLFVISFLTGGTAAASAAGLAGFGRYTEESWANSRDSSWEGIKRMYEKGKITAEQFQSFTMIRSLNDSEWAEIENDYQKGLISQEEFETMQQIREMPEEWRTAENFEKGMLYGLANGTWEGIQWYVGGKIAGMKFASSPIGNAAIKVGIDSGFNALDTPFRTTTTAATSDKTWEEAWEEQGGWQSVLINLGVGLLGSSLGEIIDYKIANKNKTNIDTNSTDINTETIKNTIDPEHGFQLSADDMGDFYKANIKNGFFTNEQIENMLNQINSKGYVDEITGEKLKKLFTGDNDIYIKTINNADLDSIMDEGVRCLGNSTSGGNAAPNRIENIDLDNTITKVTNGGLYDLLIRLKNSNGISQGGNLTDGAIIIEIPKGSSLEEILKFNPELGIYNIDPKYNLGFIECDENGILDGSKFLQTAGEKINLDSNLNEIVGKRVNLSSISKEQLKEIINNPQRIYSNANDQLFESLAMGNGSYGIDQGALKKLFLYETPDGVRIKPFSAEYNECIRNGIPLKKYGNERYFEIKSILQEKYNMSAKDASKIISALDSIGACSYASATNEIVGFFKNSPELFEEIFGFPLYRQMPDGTWAINDAEILTDLYVFANNTENGGKLIFTNKETGQNIVNWNEVITDQYGTTKLYSGNSQQYMMQPYQLNDELFNKYLHSKYKKIDYNSGVISEAWYNPLSPQEMDYIIYNVIDLMEKGNQISLYISQSPDNIPIRFVDMYTGNVICNTNNWNEGGAHAVFVTGVTNQGFIVSTWGHRCLIPFEDLQKTGAFSTFYSNISKHSIFKK